ncbi:hypothetical protein [Desulfolithobacter sp.]
MTRLIATDPGLWTMGWALLLFLLLGGVILHLRRTVGRQKQRIGSLETMLAKAEEKIHQLEARRREQEEFLETLASAEITTRLQKPRLELHQDGTVETPEKYRYVASMVQNGMTMEEIASILAIAPAEARQLVTLARMAARS